MLCLACLRTYFHEYIYTTRIVYTLECLISLCPGFEYRNCDRDYPLCARRSCSLHNRNVVEDSFKKPTEVSRRFRAARDLLILLRIPVIDILSHYHSPFCTNKTMSSSLACLTAQAASVFVFPRTRFRDTMAHLPKVAQRIFASRHRVKVSLLSSHVYAPFSSL